MADFLEEEQDLRDQVTTALTYPMVVFGLAIVVAIVTMGFMLPSFEGLLEELGDNIPPLSRFMMDCSAFLRQWGVAILAVLLLIAYVVRKRLRTHASMQSSLERTLMRLPAVGPALRALTALRFSRTLSLLIGQGVPLDEALGLAGRSSGSTLVDRSIASAREDVRQGVSLADSLRTVPILNDYLPAWVRAGEASGELVPLLENAARRLQREWEKRVKRLVALIEPVVIILVGVMVLLVALSVLLPILSLNQSIKP